MTPKPQLEYVAKQLGIAYKSLSRILSVVPLSKVQNERGYWESPADVGLQLKVRAR